MKTKYVIATIMMFTLVTPAMAQKPAKDLEYEEYKKRNRERCSRLYVGKPVTVGGFDYPAKAVIVGVGPELDNGNRHIAYKLNETACIRGTGCMRAGEVGEFNHCKGFE